MPSEEHPESPFPYDIPKEELTLPYDPPIEELT